MISCSHELEEDEMRYNTLSEYDDEIKRIDEILDNFEEYIENYPEDAGFKPTRMSLMYLREELKKERTDMRELQEEHSIYSRNEIIQVLDEVNTQYGLNFKLKTRNIITTPNLGDLPDEDMAKLIKLDACPMYFNYVFDVEDIMPILKKRVEYEW